MWWLILLIPIFLLVVLLIISSMVSSAATFNQAQAVVETARLGQKVADQNGALVFQNTVLMVLLIVVFVAALGAIIWFFLRDRRRDHEFRLIQDGGNGKWVSGPNANWQRLGGQQHAALPGADMNQMITALVMTKLLEQLNTQPRLPETTQYQNSQGNDSQDWGGW